MRFISANAQQKSCAQLRSYGINVKPCEKSESIYDLDFFLFFLSNQGMSWALASVFVFTFFLLKRQDLGQLSLTPIHGKSLVC